MSGQPTRRIAAGALGARGWQLAFGEVIHSRLRPTSHAFRYPAFFLRLPARDLDQGASGNWLFGVNRAALLSMHAADHGRGETGARG